MNSKRHKDRLRDQFKRARARHASIAAELSQNICQRLAELDGTIAVYAALPGEVRLDAAVDRWMSCGRNVLYPRVSGPGRMEFVRVQTREELVTGHFGILEPLGATWPGEIDTVLVPGLAFDLAGNRLGFGAGYYDRFLDESRPLQVIGVGFDWQVVSQLPAEPHDIAMDWVVTDRRTYLCR